MISITELSRLYADYPSIRAGTSHFANIPDSTIASNHHSSTKVRINGGVNGESIRQEKSNAIHRLSSKSGSSQAKKPKSGQHRLVAPACRGEKRVTGRKIEPLRTTPDPNVVPLPYRMAIFQHSNILLLIKLLFHMQCILGSKAPSETVVTLPAPRS